MTALPHELTHLILADRFSPRQVPRWSDEGMAVLADPAEKQRLHLRDLRQALADARVPELARPTLDPGESLAEVRAETPDIEALAARGMAYERLDQLAMDHLLGVR